VTIDVRRRWGNGACFLCGKEDAGDLTFCDCERKETCKICYDQLHMCQDCGAEYCGACFHTKEHNLCLPPESDHPNHDYTEKRWCRLCKK